MKVKTANKPSPPSFTLTEAMEIKFAEMREILLSCIAKDAQSSLESICCRNGYVDRYYVADLTLDCVKAIARLVKILLNNTVWLDDKTESPSDSMDWARDTELKLLKMSLDAIDGECLNIQSDIKDYLAS